MDFSETMFHKCRNLLIVSFETNPSYSFGDPSLMIDHAIQVQEIAMNISDTIECNKEVVFLGSIFHDIGKTKMIDGKTVPWEILREKHESFNYEVIASFLEENSVENSTREFLQELFNEGKGSIESHIIKDADIIEFYMNIRLQKALKIWGDNQGFPHELQRKADKFNSIIALDISKQIALPYLNLMKNRWNLK